MQTFCVSLGKNMTFFKKSNANYLKNKHFF